LLRGRRSRNKVSVGEPAEGSLYIPSPERGLLLVITGWTELKSSFNHPARRANALFEPICVFSSFYKIQGLAVDESVRIAMKIVANCVNQCELQQTASTLSLNARCA
jgi:hypothetical protein